MENNLNAALQNTKKTPKISSVKNMLVGGEEAGLPGSVG